MLRLVFELLQEGFQTPVAASAERRDMLKQITVGGVSFSGRFCGASEVDAVPQRDSGGDEMEAPGTVTLGLKERSRISPSPAAVPLRE